MNSLNFLGKVVTAIIDRPIGSKHSNKYPNHIYPVNYGYIPNTISGDNEELDCYVLGVFEPVKEFTGTCIAIIRRINDDDDKLIITPDGKNFSDNEIYALTEFQERFFKTEIIRDPNYLYFNKNIPELSVTNLKNSLNFYKSAGFKVEYERPENKFAFISLGDVQFMLQELSDNDKWNLAPLTFPFGNGINFQIEVSDLSTIYDCLKSANYPIAFDVEENWYRNNNKLLGCKEFLVQDPDGYLFRFSQDLGSKNI